jgi:hypothetical protein
VKDSRYGVTRCQIKTSNVELETKLLPAVIETIASILCVKPESILKAPAEEDMRRNTDLVLLQDGRRIACRVRSHRYLYDKTRNGIPYYDQFTIRSSLASGNKTELLKIIEGWGDGNFYGFSNKQENGLDAWVFGRLNVFRRWMFEELVKNKGVIPAAEVPNLDGRESFMPFNISDLPDDFVKARRIPDFDQIAANALKVSQTSETCTDFKFDWNSQGQGTFV